MPQRIDWDARKAQLGEAVWAVILEQGVSAVSMRTVARQAGVVVGSLRHIFPTRAELVVFSAELVIQRVTERIRALPPQGNLREHALAVIACAMPLDARSRAEFEVNLALYAENPAIAQITELRDAAHEQLAQLTLKIVVELTGSPQDDQAIQQARRLHGLIDGLALHLLHQPVEADSGWAMQIIAAELDSISQHAADEETVDSVAQDVNSLTSRTLPRQSTQES